MFLLCAELRDEPFETQLTLLSRGVKAITHHDTLTAPAEVSCRSQHPGLHKEGQGLSSYICTRKPALLGTTFCPWANRHVTANLHPTELSSPSLASPKLPVGNDAHLWGQLPRLVDLGQNLPGATLNMFQHKGTFASVTVTHRALMPCNGHCCVFRGHWGSWVVWTPACSMAKENC